jgi:hypothetical protein
MTRCNPTRASSPFILWTGKMVNKCGIIGVIERERENPAVSVMLARQCLQSISSPQSLPVITDHRSRGAARNRSQLATSWASDHHLVVDWCDRFHEISSCP